MVCPALSLECDGSAPLSPYRSKGQAWRTFPRERGKPFCHSSPGIPCELASLVRVPLRFAKGREIPRYARNDMNVLGNHEGCPYGYCDGLLGLQLRAFWIWGLFG